MVPHQLNMCAVHRMVTHDANLQQLLCLVMARITSKNMSGVNLTKVRPLLSVISFMQISSQSPALSILNNTCSAIHTLAENACESVQLFVLDGFVLHGVNNPSDYPNNIDPHTYSWH